MLVLNNCLLELRLECCHEDLLLSDQMFSSTAQIVSIDEVLMAEMYLVPKSLLWAGIF